MVLLTGKEGLIHRTGKDIQNVFQNLFKQRGKWRREAAKLDGYYTTEAPHARNDGKMVVCMFDGRMKHGGLVDRFRGIVSSYSVCKPLHIPFKIHFVHPFRLETYLMPNQVDWRIESSELCYNRADAFPVFCGSNDTHVEPPFQRLWLKQNFQKQARQVHVYTNAHLLRGKAFGPLFRELFRPTPVLQATIDVHLAMLGGDYVAMSSRFMALLGDFEDCNDQTLPPSDRAAYVQRVIDKIKDIHAKECPTSKVLIASDSVTFLAEAARLDFAYIVPGNVVHVDYTSGNQYDTYMKVFVDFFLLAKARKIYLLQQKGMYNTGFPRRAAQVGNIPLKHVRF